MRVATQLATIAVIGGGIALGYMYWTGTLPGQNASAPAQPGAPATAGAIGPAAVGPALADRAAAPVVRAAVAVLKVRRWSRS